ncbi:hypothetical protein COU56_01655 [Candidatus Pacearchaeota archaeon CG10_big_fil_rev_8_21_14_0_10_31_9]|nr:MAG: hypothetical protein AUJ62_01065 [Candidatus Pacearchaeota archaeon CG1_02_32_21]PIN95436.1 MAG: hypothetical protein COU56_01655 [Candidatus Pacearchaeota archaeon CG10_big_fil_rev_8_21_14_0_10_31_9]PIZ82450.1 MAG: hypothetical protein COX97_04810 [Candidatus Pacearchaeota archaeon CG_4_10_14_0_2_um_filter_05_32_18]
MKTRETYHILLVLIVLIFAVILKPFLTNQDYNVMLIAATSITLAVLINIATKKITAYYFETSIEHKIWSVDRYWLRRKDTFKNKIPFGILIPFIATIASLGNFLFLAALEFDIKTLTSRVSKRHEWYKFTDITDFHLGVIAASGVILNLVFAVIGYLAGFSLFAKLNIYYAFYCMLPLWNLDGTKIFFANKNIWAVLGAIVIIFLLYALFLP